MGYWKLPGQYNKLTRDNISRFNAKSGRKTIESVLLNPTAYKKDLLSRFRKGGRAPDYFYSYSDLNSNLLWKKIAGVLEDYFEDSKFYKDEISNKEYRKSVLNEDGKLFALPYYGSHSAFIYNEAHIKKAGFDEPPRDWNELEQQALKIKEKGIADAPILVPIHGDGSVETLYAVLLGMNEKSNSYLFDEDQRAKFDQEGSALFNVLDWMIQGIYRKRIVSRECVAHDVLPGAQQMKKGRFTFIWLPWYLLSYINYPNGRTRSPIKEGLNPGSGITTCYTRTYTVSLSALRDKTKQSGLWRVLEYFGGKTNENLESDREHGEYRVAKRLGTELGIPSPIKSLWDDQEYCSALDRWGDMEIYKRQDENVFNSLNDPYSPPWLAEWDGEWQSAPLRNTVHRILLKEMSKRDLLSSLSNLSKSWNEFRKKYSR